MVLTDKVIEEEIFKGNIVIGGYNPKHLNPNSYDLTLAPTCKIHHPEAIADTIFIPDQKRLEYLDWSYDIEQSEEWCLDVKQKDTPTFEFEIPSTGFVLQPNHLYLYSCREILAVKKDICATVMGKSSLGRLGLDIHVCAGFVDTGFQGSLVLEMRTIYPLRIYPNMKICQVKFERTEGLVRESYDKKSGSKYMGQMGVQESKMADNFANEDETLDEIIRQNKLKGMLDPDDIRESNGSADEWHGTDNHGWTS